MSFNGEVKADEPVVLIDRDSTPNKVIWARSMKDFQAMWGGSALFDVSVIKGLRGVSVMTVNTNFWDVYREDDPVLAKELLKIMFEVNS